MNNDLISAYMNASAYETMTLDKKYPDIEPNRQMAELKQYMSSVRDSSLNHGKMVAGYFDDMYSQAQDLLDQELNGEAAGTPAAELDETGQYFMNHPMVKQQLDQFEQEFKQQQEDVKNGLYTFDDLMTQQQARADNFDGKLPNENATYSKGNFDTSKVDQEFAPVEGPTNA